MMNQANQLPAELPACSSANQMPTNSGDYILSLTDNSCFDLLDDEPNECDISVFLLDGQTLNFHFSCPSLQLTCDQILNRVNAQLFANDSESHLEKEAKRLFCLWIESPLLQLQLKSEHRPFCLLRRWDTLLAQFANQKCSLKHLKRDTPSLIYRRDVFAPITLEQTFQSHPSHLLYEAMDNVCQGRYPVDDEQAIDLAAHVIRAIHPDASTVPPAFCLSNLSTLLPQRMLTTLSGTFTFGRQKSKLAKKVLEQYLKLPSTDELSSIEAMNKALEMLRALPVYGSAFFEAQVERPVSSIASLVSHPDMKVWIAINMFGLHLVTQKDSSVLLSLPHGQFGWEVALPSNPLDPNRLPCVFLHVQRQPSSADLLQVFTRQAVLVQTLLEKLESRTCVDQVDAHSVSGISTTSSVSLSADQDATLEKLRCASFDVRGRCVRKRGSFTLAKRHTTKPPPQ